MSVDRLCRRAGRAAGLGILLMAPLRTAAVMALPAPPATAAVPAASAASATAAAPAVPVASAASATAAAPATAAVPAASWKATGSIWSVPPFEFRDGFWTNLHHFLYQEALAMGKGQASGETRQAPNPTEPPGPRGEDERTAWSEALRFYAGSVVQHDLLFEREMIDIDYALAGLADDASLRSPALKPELAAALVRAAPVYRARWWPAHDRANRFWIAVATPMVQQLGPRMIEQLAAAYHEPWPARPILVDVAVYANWAGAYTTPGDEARPGHTIVSSANPGNQGFAALETVFHEASHVFVDQANDAVTHAIEKESRARRQEPPPKLTHAIIFYTAGELARRNLAAVGVADYVPSAERYGLWTRVWPTFKPALEEFWQPYLDGKTTLDTAVARVVASLGGAGAKAVPR